VTSGASSSPAILSEAKDLALACAGILRCAQDDMALFDMAPFDMALSTSTIR
jgi:hypothetical protein